MGRKLLTLSDLYDFYCKQNKSVVFNSANEDTEIVVQVDGSINFEKIDNTNGLMPVVLQACHTGKNLNQSSIADKVMKAALPSFSNLPPLPEAVFKTPLKFLPFIFSIPYKKHFLCPPFFRLFHSRIWVLFPIKTDFQAFNHKM